MADSVSTLDPGVIALIQRLGLSGALNGSQNGYGQTVGGQPAVFDPGTINPNNASGQGGFTDQELLANPNAAPDAREALGTWSGNMKLSDLSNARQLFDQNQLANIEKLLTGKNNAPQVPPINLSTQLNNQTPPNVSPVINGASGGYINPSASFLPGMGPTASPAPGSLPSLTASTAPSAATLSSTQNLINQQADLPHAPVSMQDPLTIVPANNPGAVTNMIKQAGGPLQASAENGISPGSLPAPSSVPTTPMMRSYAPPAPLQTTMPSGHAGQSGYVASSSAVPGGVAASGGEGYLPASANTGPTVGPTVVKSANGYSVDPNTASANQPTDSAAAGGGFQMSPQIAGTIASGLGKVGAALAPRTITNDAQTKINPRLLPSPVVFGAPVLTGR